MQSTRMLIDTTTVAVAARGHLTLPAALAMLGETVEEGGVYYAPSALDQLQHLEQTKSVLIYLPAGQAIDAEKRMDQLSLVEHERRGAVFTTYARAAKYKGYREASTVAVLERGANGQWFVTHIGREWVNDYTHDTLRVPRADAATVARRLGRGLGVDF